MPNRAPISVCLIVKNEEMNIVRCLTSIRPYVEEIVVVDTGSTDRTPELVRGIADAFEVYTDCNYEDGTIKSFSAARQRSFDLATKPWVMWIDGDDVVQGAEKLPDLIASLDAKRQGGPAVVVLPYEYAHDEEGNCTCLHYRERIVTPRSDFKWVNPVHEILMSVEGSTPPTQFSDDSIRMIHKRGELAKVSDPMRNLRIIKSFVEESEKEDPRQLYYLGQEYAGVGDVENAIKTYARYVEITGWDDEKCLALIKLSELNVQKADFKAAVEWATRSITVKENWSETYFSLAKAYYYWALVEKDVGQKRRHFEKCVMFCKVGLSMPPTKTALFVNPQEKALEIHRYFNIALNATGDVRGALESVNYALAVKPKDEQLLLNKKVYEDHLLKQDVSDGLRKLKENGVDISSLPLSGVSGPSWKSYHRPHGYPRNVTEDSFPVAAKTPHSQAWGIPESYVLDDLPIVMSEGQLQAFVVAMWKEYMLHDELMSAKSFLERAPFRVRHTDVTERMLRDTNKMLEWTDDEEQYDAGNASLNADLTPRSTEMVPFEIPLTGAAAQRFVWISDRLKPGTKILDMGCIDGEMSNRWGAAGHKVTGLDICSNSVKIANDSAARHGTGARHIRTFFKDAPAKLGGEKFEVVTCADTYEHLKDPVNELLKPARQMVAEDGKMLLLTPAGAWFRGKFSDNAHPWLWSLEDQHWLVARPRGHLFAPTVWETIDHFRSAGWWVQNCTVVAQPHPDVPGQGNVAVEAHPNPPKRNGKKVVFYVGNGVEEWNPHSVDINGIGGSETAAIQMSKRLVKLGYEVHIYSSCGAAGEGIYDGVEYRTTDKFHDIETDILVVSRWTPALGEASVKAKVKYLWTHDVIPLGITHESLLKADKILALSQWHKQHIKKSVPFADAEKINVTRNGLDPERFRARPPRNPHKIIYASSPDRGLHALLENWGEIRKRVPDAELHVFYGFKVWQSTADDAQSRLITDLQRRLAEMKDQGVHTRGRVNQQTLAWEFLTAGVWAYPTWFSETSCITAMEAQAAGLRIVTSPIAALNETVADRGTMIEGNWLSNEYGRKFVDAVVNACNFEGDRETGMQDAAQRFDWNGVAQEWSEMFESDVTQDIPTLSYASLENP